MHLYMNPEIDDFYEIIFGMMNHSPNYITILDNQGYINFINQGFSVLSVDEIVGSKIFSLVVLEDRELFRNAMLEVFENKTMVTVQTRSIGELSYINYLKPIIRDDEVDKIIMYSLDITDIDAERNELQNKVHYLNQFISQIPETVITTNEDGIINDIRGKGKHIFGYEKKELIGESISFILKNKDFDDINKIVEEKGIFTGDIYTISKAGKDIYTQFSLNNLYNAEGKIQGKIGVLVDQSEKKNEEQRRKKLEERVLKQQYLENLGLMAGGIAHNLNNYLQGIIGNIELVLHQKDVKDDTIKYLKEVMEISSQASMLANQLLTYTGNQEFRLETIILKDYIHNFKAILFNLIPENIVFKEIYLDNIPVIMIDITQVNQIIINLIKNSVEAIKGDGEISLKFGFERINKEYGYLVIIIEDNGRGIEESEFDKLFKPFYSTKFIGRGLGLAVVEAIVEKFDGKINVSSEIGNGSTFTLHLKVKYTDENIIESKSIKFKNKMGNTILFVDDEKIIRKVGKKMLETFGFSCILAVDGVDCLEKYNLYNNDIDLIILDLSMPKKNGIETLKELQIINKDIKVLLSSGYTDFLINDLLCDTVEFIHKPYYRDTLIEKIVSMID